MVKVALQHWIFETCINVFFDNIMSNFKSDGDFKEGDVFEYIKLVYSLQLEDGPDAKAITELFDAKIFSIDTAENCCNVTCEKMINWEPISPMEVDDAVETKLIGGKLYCKGEIFDSEFFFSLHDVKNYRKKK